MGFVCGVFLLFSLPALVRTEVVQDFNTCPDLFLNINAVIFTPTILVDPQNQDRYKKICQRRDINNRNYEFATLYDTLNKIPVFSAYRVRTKTSTNRNENWYIEPQLDNSKDNSFQGTEKLGRDGATMGIHQALKEDYKNSGYDKGHLFPVSHADTQETADATFTLTNVVPQDRCLNEVWWKDLEGKIIDYLDNYLKQQQQGNPVANNLVPGGPVANNIVQGHTAYVVTGAVPGSSTISNTVNVKVPGNSKIRKISNTVNVPGYLWTAFCYYDLITKQWVSKAHYAPNDRSQIVIELSVTDLETRLSGSNRDGYNQNFSIFQGNCKSDINNPIYHHD
ncbi:endonuclease domain-containing 1 protein [Salmo trutta]|uniref:endonuclease domain-containing 1 protein n=1 Tax=Salmo trutta TaxID=8032 RepID=UPI0011312DFA|nr:endonuclease domain-containing 1 protein-like [Salmo trutta]